MELLSRRSLEQTASLVSTGSAQGAGGAIATTNSTTSLSTALIVPGSSQHDLYVRARQSFLLGDFETAEPLYVEISQRHDIMCQALAHQALGDIYAKQPNREQAALQSLGRAGALFRTMAAKRSAAATTTAFSIPTALLTTSCGENDEEGSKPLCLDAMVVETLQKRANLYSKQKNLDEALECHEEVIDYLLDLQDKKSPALTGAFSTMTEEKQIQLMLVSMESLASLYQKVSEEGRDLKMGSFEDALEVIREKNHTPEMKKSMARILQSSSEVYQNVGEMEIALECLDEAIDLSLSVDESPVDLLASMELLGLYFEENDLLDDAMACYEKVLLVRSKLFGNNDIVIAKSLIKVARVMEMQDNIEGSLDLYRAAQAIYQSRLASDSVSVESEDVNTLLELFPTAMEQGRYEDAVSYLSKCVEVAEDKEKAKNLNLDKTFIYFNMGKAYVGLQDYVSATICLVEAAKHDGAISEEQVFALLQRVEFLQRDGQDPDDASATSYASAASQEEKGKDVVAVGTPEANRGDSPGTNSRALSTPETSVPISCGSKTAKTQEPDTESDEGTAYYDSESVSVFDPLQRPQVAFGSMSETDEPSIAIDGIPSESDVDGFGVTSESELEGSNIKLPDLGFPSEYEYDNSETADPLIPRLKLDELSSKQDASCNESSALPSLLEPNYSGESTSSRSRGLRFLGVASRKKKELKAPAASGKGSLAKSLTSKFRRQRKTGFESLSEGQTEHPTSEETPKTPTSSSRSFPSEEEYHEFDGPVQYVLMRSASWESNVSQITMRFEDPGLSKYVSQEWWWSVTSEGLSRWFPTSYVSKAVEAAEGFLSAQAIHDQKKAAPLQHSSSDSESLEGLGLRDFASNAGIATEVKTLQVAHSNDVLAKAKLAEMEEAESLPHGPKNDGTLSVYSGRPLRQAIEVESEIKKYSELVEKQREQFRRDHPDVAASLFTLAVLLSRNNETARAIECAAESLRIQKALGEVKDAARSLHFLADIYLHQRQYSTALTFYNEALRLETTHYGELSDEAAKTLNCIGTVHSLMNEFARAMDSHQEALRILKECHGEDLKHPLVSETLCQIGAVYYRERNSFSKSKPKQDGDYATFIEAGMLETIGRAHEDRGTYKLAISFFEEKLQFLECRINTTNEDDMEEVATTLNSLGMLSSRAGFYVDAIDYYERALKVQLKIGCDKVQIATARVLTGAVHFQLGDWQKALKLHLEALGVLREELGYEHQTVAATLFQIAVVRAALCEFNAAKSTFAQVLTIQKRLLGSDHPATLRTRREIANLHAVYKSGTDTALEQLDAILVAQRRQHGDRHPNIAETLQSIGRIHARREDYPKALQILEECYYMRTEFLGWDHPQQASTLYEICLIHLKRGRTKKALQICDVVLGVRQESLSEEHLDIALALALKGNCQVSAGKLEAAEPLYKEALAIAESAVGPVHPSVAEIHLQICMMFVRKCQFEDARKSADKAISIFKKMQLPEDFAGYEEALETLKRVERDEMLYV